MRWAIALLASLGLLAGGGYLAWGQLSCAAGLVAGRCMFGGAPAVGAGTMLFVGGYLLWEGVVVPVLRRGPGPG